MDDTYLNAARRQQKVIKESSSLVDLLAVLLIGGIGLFIALLGLYFDNLAFLIVGYVIAIASAGKAINEYIISCINLRDRLRNRKKDQ